MDDGRCKKIEGLSIREKFAYVIDLIKQDKEYPREYDRFVKSMSYANIEKMQSFEESLSSVESLMNHVLK